METGIETYPIKRDADGNPTDDFGEAKEIEKRLERYPDDKQKVALARYKENYRKLGAEFKAEEYLAAIGTENEETVSRILDIHVASMLIEADERRKIEAGYQYKVETKDAEKDLVGVNPFIGDEFGDLDSLLDRTLELSEEKQELSQDTLNSDDALNNKILEFEKFYKSLLVDNKDRVTSVREQMIQNIKDRLQRVGV